MRRVKRIALGLILLVVLLSLGLVSTFGERALERWFHHEIDRAWDGRASLGAVKLSWLPPAIRISDLELDREDEAVRITLREAWVRPGIWASLWEGAWIADVSLIEPDIEWSGELPAFGGENDGLALPFLPRELVVRSGRLSWSLPDFGARGRLEDVDVDGSLRGLLQPRLSFSVRGRSIVERAGKGVLLEHVAFEGEARDRELIIHAAELTGADQSVRVSGRWTSGGLEGTVGWDGDLEPLLGLVPEAGEIRGSGSIEARVSGSVREPVVNTRLEARGVVIDGVEFSGTGRLHSQGVQWRLTSADVSMFGGRIRGEANGRWTGGIPYALHGGFEDWDPAAFLEWFDLSVPLRASWHGELRLEGNLLGEDVEGDGVFRLVHDDEEVGGNASFRVRGETLAEVEGRIGEVSAGRLTARYAVEESDIAGEFAFEGERLSRLLAFLWADRIEGRGQVRGVFEGTTDEPRVRGEIDLVSVEVGDGRLGTVRGPFSLSTIALDSPGIEAFDGRLQAHGRVPFTTMTDADWTLDLHELPLGEAAEALRVVWPDAPAIETGGQVSGRFSGSGTMNAPRVEGTLAVSELRVAGEGPVGFEGTIDLAEESGSILGELSGHESLRASLALDWTPEGTLSGRLESEGGRLEDLMIVQERWPDLRGSVRVAATVAGKVSEPRAETLLELRELWVGEEEELRDVIARLQLRGDRLELEATAADLWTAAGAIRLAADTPFEVEAQFRDLDLQPFLAPESDMQLRISGGGRLRGSSAVFLGEGRLELTTLSIVRGPVRLSSAEPVTIIAREGELRIERLDLSGPGQQLAVEATFSERRSEVHAKGRGELGLLETLLPGVASARGQMDLEIRGARSHDRPWTVYGGATVSDAAMDVGFLVGVTDVSGEIRFDGDRAEILGWTGRLGGGGILIDGTVARRDGWDLGWALREASLGVPDWLDYRASGNGRLRGSLERPELTGEIEILRALYDQPVEWAEFLPWFRREARRSTGDVELPIDVDLRVFADGGLFVDNNLVEAELASAVDVTGTHSDLRWRGRLDVIAGDFIFRRRRFMITAGTVQFPDRRPLNPDLEFRGETTVSTGEADYEIGVHVTGTAERPRIEFTADDPTLTENDVLALVTFGRTVSQLQAQGAGFELSEVLALTAGPRADDVEERIYRFVPLDRIEIQPSFSRTTGTTEPRLSIGKDLTENLRALLGSGLGSERQQDIALEYQLTPRMALQGAWESQTKSRAGAFGGDLKFRFPFRRFRDLVPFPEASDEP